MADNELNFATTEEDEGLKFKWAYIEGDLDVVFGYSSIDWEGLGFTIPGIRWAVNNRYQLPNAEGTTISLFPIENEAIFNERLGAVFSGKSSKYRVVNQAECDTIHAELVALSERRAAEQARVASEEEVYQGQELLLLTEIANNTRDILAYLVNNKVGQNNG